jgi:hypothetical protein
MKPIIVDDQTFTKKADFIDFAGPILAQAKQINNQKDILRAFRHGNHFGKDFTMIVKAAYKGGGVDVEALKELALKHGAKLKEIDACKSPRVASASAVSFVKN